MSPRLTEAQAPFADQLDVNTSMANQRKFNFAHVLPSITWSIALIAAIGAPLVLIGFGFAKSQSIDDDKILTAQWVPASKPASWPEYNVEAKVTLAKIEIKTSAVIGMSGMVTKMPQSPPARLVSGTYVLSVNGIDLNAYAGATPFYRPLNFGMKGPDVLELNRLLSSFGYAADSYDRWGSVTELGARQYLKDIGVVPGSNTEFQPSYIVWVPEAGVDIGGYAVSPGQLLTAPMAEAFSKKQVIQSISFDAQSDIARMAKRGWKIEYNSTSYDYSGDPANIIDSAQMKKLQIPPGSETVRVKLSTGFAADTLSVPPSAVVSGKSGSQCLISRSSNGIEAVPVKVAGGEVGRTFVEPTEGVVVKEILANPISGNEKLMCK